MNKKIVVSSGSVLAVVVGFLAYTYLADRSTPAGQPPLTELNEPAFDRFREEFNRARGQVRIIALLSPT